MNFFKTVKDFLSRYQKLRHSFEVNSGAALSHFSCIFSDAIKHYIFYTTS